MWKKDNRWEWSNSQNFMIKDSEIRNLVKISWFNI